MYGGIQAGLIRGQCPTCPVPHNSPIKHLQLIIDGETGKVTRVCLIKLPRFEYLAGSRISPGRFTRGQGVRRRKRPYWCLVCGGIGLEDERDVNV